MNRAVFLDRDGVINRKAEAGGYVTSWAQMEFLPGVSEGIRLLNEAGFQTVVVTNQRCVAKGLITREELEALHQKMRDHIKSLGGTIDDIFYCPHEVSPPCGCRKPNPGMLLEAGRAHQIDMSSSWMIGDSEADMQAGRAAGCKVAWVGTGNRFEPSIDLRADTLLEAAHEIVSRES